MKLYEVTLATENGNEVVSEVAAETKSEAGSLALREWGRAGDRVSRVIEIAQERPLGWSA